MKTQIINLQNLSREQEDKVFNEAAKIIQKGGLVAFPTETVYGLGANALNEKASAKIYAAKGRPSDNPLIAHVANLEQVSFLAKEISDKAKILMNKFWPGPMTLIFKKTQAVPLGTTGGLETVAVRMPNHPVALRLIAEAKVPIAAPSANLSGRPSPTLATHVADDLSGNIEMILDGGSTGIGIESTIIDMSEDVPVILRPGYITKEMLDKVIGSVEKDKALLESEWKNVKPKAPGMKYKHYAPKANLTIVEGNKEQVIEKISQMAKKAEKEGKKVGIICTDETKKDYFYKNVKSMGKRNDINSIAHNLYRVLREFDETQVELIYSEGFGETPLGEAVMNRLVKAAGHQIIHL